jgi:hypothetical protein
MTHSKPLTPPIGQQETAGPAKTCSISLNKGYRLLRAIDQPSAKHCVLAFGTELPCWHTKFLSCLPPEEKHLSVEVMKMRTVNLTPKFLTEAMQGKATAVTPNMPSDIELLDIKYDLASHQITAIIRSDSFEDIPEAFPIPELKMNAVAKPQPAPQQPPTMPKLEPVPAKKPPQAQPTQLISKIENEFSPDQRKLLSFKIEGENVIVKPIQFLKAEWEDINEVVRSLGGKWVKGDIISYWAIPLQNY